MERVSATMIYHPERRFFAKGLGNAQDDYSLKRLFKEDLKSQDRGQNRKLSAQILRPKEGLRMTML